VIFNILLVVLSQTTWAAVSPYSPPCNDTDIEFRGGSCPNDTAQIVHTRCLTQDEIDQRNERSGNLITCTIGQTLIRSPEGILQCANNFFGQ
jgi:hypothetical protein